MKSPLRSVKPYLPATLTIAVVLILGLVFRRELDDWFAGRPLGVAALSRPRTLDAGPFRVAVATRPAVAIAGEPLELFAGVGDAAGVLRDDATVTAGELAVERRARGQFTISVPTPESGTKDVVVQIAAGHESGALTLRIAPGKGFSVAGEEATGIAWWTCPMHPSVHAPQDGLCPICHMDLTPVTYEELKSGAVRVDAQRRQLIGLETAKVVRGALHLETRASGLVRVPEVALREVTARAGGWIDSVAAPPTGEKVTRGALLAEITSPELFAAQAEYQVAVKSGLEGVVAAARARLRLLGAGEGLGRGGKADGRLALRAPIDGTMIFRGAVAGAPVPTDAPLFRIAALDPIWVEARVHEADAPLAVAGAGASVTTALLPGKVFEGKIELVAPMIDPETRTLIVRLSLPNPDGALRPDAFVEVALASTLEQRLIVPAEAVIWTGPRRLVFVEAGEGRLKPVEVTVGVRGREGYEVLGGLAEGDSVVTSGQFLVGAESRLRSALGAW